MRESHALSRHSPYAVQEWMRVKNSLHNKNVQKLGNSVQELIPLCV
jgi:hypothetical protein